MAVSCLVQSILMNTMKYELRYKNSVFKDKLRFNIIEVQKKRV